MIAYLDASVLLRIVLEQPNPLAEWDELYGGVSSTLLDVECQRTFDRYRQQNRMDATTLAAKHVETKTILGRLEIIPITEIVLEIASQPLPTILGTLDAIHLATATLYRASQSPDERPLVFATHDRALAAAARAMNFDVLGDAAG